MGRQGFGRLAEPCGAGEPQNDGDAHLEIAVGLGLGRVIPFRASSQPEHALHQPSNSGHRGPVPAFCPSH